MSERIHESLERLLACAIAATKGKLGAVVDPGTLGDWMGESVQTINNWKSARGVSKAGALKGAALFGCNANWVLDGSGEMGTPSAKEAYDLDEALRVVARAIDKEDRIAKLSMELLVAVMQKQSKETGSNAQGDSDNSGSVGHTSDGQDGRTPPTVGLKFQIKSQPKPKGRPAQDDQDIPVPNKKRGSGR